MAATAHFQLFPPPPGKRPTNPFRRPSKRQTFRGQTPSPIPLENLKPAGNTEALLIQIIEDTKSIQPPPIAHVNMSGSPEISRTPDPSENPRSVSRNGTIDNLEILQSTQPRAAAPNGGSSAIAVPQTTSPQSTISRSPNTTPLVTMRSIFPRYNPDQPLSRQEYFPQNAGPNQQSNEVKSAAPGAADLDAILGPKTVPASVMNFPVDVFSYREVHFSSADELESLWEAANGQQSQNVLSTFNLPMTRTDPATFVFGDCRSPFYTLQTFSDNSLAITRAHPLKPNRKIPVMMLNLEDRRRRQTPNDGLVTVIFSQLAAMLAAEQATELTRLHLLASTEAMEVESNAVKRAAAQESCRLFWNDVHKRYELQHPSLLKQHVPTPVGDDGMPLSRVQTADPGTLHITISKPSPNDLSHPRPPTIIVTNPMAPNAVEAAMTAATPRTSTLPLSDSDEPIASLDLGTMCLSISAGMTATIIPSLYAIDSLIAAILAVAVSDEMTNSVMGDMELYVPGHDVPLPRHQHRSSIATTATTVHSKSYTGRLFTTIAERVEAEQEERLMSQLRSKEDNQKRSFFGVRTGSKSKNKKVVIDEIDLERYGRYRNGSSRRGEKLPCPIRLVLRLMILTLQVIVRALSLGVRFLAWLLMNATRCVTSETL
ncbi:hypothetical protein Egran_03502 [Elaphomyces granulatus]|uniref:Uncharacterized protein n=1 Tax=Elaphomyces granulatus TaxID=519963 RepID=A0A232LXA8_9EURO|nr:hypothetical protein Egran_03502 [Elaphomyces granulatus]